MQDKGSENKNFAVVVMISLVEFSYFIQPICMPNDISVENFDEGTVVKISMNSFLLCLKKKLIFLQVGWGMSENGDPFKSIQLQVTMNSVNETVCFTEDYRIAEIASLRTFCAGGKNSGPCSGDSGLKKCFYDYLQFIIFNLRRWIFS